MVERNDLHLGAQYPIREFGLLDIDGDRYVAHVFATLNETGVDGDEAHHGALLTGGFDGKPPVVHVTTHAKLDKSGAAPVSNQFHAPRIDGGQIHFLSHSDTSIDIYRDGKPLVSTLDPSVTGRKTMLLGPTVSASKGEHFHTIATIRKSIIDGKEYENASMRELVRYDSSGNASLLMQTGDKLANDPRQVWDLPTFAHALRPVDKNGSLAFIVLFADSDLDETNGTHPAALVVGVPA